MTLIEVLDSIHRSFSLVVSYVKRMGALSGIVIIVRQPQNNEDIFATLRCIWSEQLHDSFRHDSKVSTRRSRQIGYRTNC
jgi:hypothetical protein